MKRILPALVAISLLVAPAAASAKELTAATVCGPSGCNSSSHPAALLPVLMGGGPPFVGVPATAHPFYRLRVVVAGGATREPMNILVVPQGRYVRGPDGAWTKTSTAVLGRIQKLAGGLRAFPASKLPGVSAPSHPDTAPTAPSPSPVAHGASFPWLAVGAVGAALLLAGGLALRLRPRA